MQEFFSWFRANAAASAKPWLILGKGNSFAQFNALGGESYRVVSLNHVVRERKVDIAHAIDIDVIRDCANSIEKNAGCLLMPWIPHERFRPGKHDLQSLCAELPLLRSLSDQGRLLFYNAATSPRHRLHRDSPVVPVTYFSAEAAFGALAMAGVRRIYALGIDGGTQYSSHFADLNERTRLANSQTSFDKQFAAIAQIAHETGAEFVPLNLPPVRIFVGATEEQDLAVQVLDFSARKYASLPVVTHSLDRAEIETPLPSGQNFGKTPFSLQRFLIPELCQRSGRALYLDSDMLILKDLRPLWTAEFNEDSILTVRGRSGTRRAPQNSVLLIDCARAGWNIDDIVQRLNSGELEYGPLMRDLAVGRARPSRVIDDSWNSLEFYRRKNTALIHYTDMHSQPWVSHRNPLGRLWFEHLFEAVNRGAIKSDAIDDAIRKGYVRPSVAYQLEHGIADARRLPGRALVMDRRFIAPYQNLQPGPAVPGAHLRHGLWHRTKSKIGRLVCQPAAG